MAKCDQLTPLSFKGLSFNSDNDSLVSDSLYQTLCENLPVTRTGVTYTPDKRK